LRRLYVDACEIYELRDDELIAKKAMATLVQEPTICRTAPHQTNTYSYIITG
jgi:hypothetical protein